MCLIPSNVYSVPPGAIRTEITEAAAPVEIGQSYSLLCRVLKNVSGLTETPTTQWFDSNGLVIEGTGVLSTGGQSTLIFSPLKTSHAGSYRCEGSVISPALEQPLVTDSTWELNIQSRSLIFLVLYINMHLFLWISTRAHSDLDKEEWWITVECGRLRNLHLSSCITQQCRYQC